jgi:hypothetical protein
MALIGYGAIVVTLTARLDGTNARRKALTNIETWVATLVDMPGPSNFLFRKCLHDFLFALRY